jgi:hypothetical protein
MRFFSMVGLAAGVFALAGGSAFAQGMSSANYSIPVSVINSGGGVASSANYTLTASIGEPIIGPTGGVAAGPPSVLRIAGGLKNSKDADVNFSASDAKIDGIVNILDAVTIARGIAAGTIGGIGLDAGFLPAALD